MTVLTLTRPAITVAPRAVLARPADLAPALLAHAESLWAAGNLDTDTDDLLADLLGLGPGGGHDQLTRCEIDGCGAWHWADEGATYQGASRDLQVCAEHAVADDPDAVIYPGASLTARIGD